MSFEELPPWKQQEYLALPVETTVAVTPTAVQACAGDPNRRIIMFGLLPGAAGAVQVSTKQLDNAASGFVLNTTTLVLTITAWDHGPLVTVPWFVSCSNPGNGTITVLTQSFIRFPGDGSYTSPFEALDSHAIISNGNRPANGNGRYYAHADSGTEPTAQEIDYLAAALQSCQRGARWQRNGNLWLPPGSWGRPSNPRL